MTPFIRMETKCLNLREMDKWKHNEGGYQNETEKEICLKEPCATCKSVSKFPKASLFC